MRTQSEETAIVNQMIHYLESALEKPHPLFGGLSICPFSKKARLQNKVLYQIIDLSFPNSNLEPDSDLLHAVKQFSSTNNYEVLLVICPDVQVSVNQMHRLIDHLNEQIISMGLIAFGGHPLDDFNIQGVYTRREPFINITVQTFELLNAARRHLKKTNYYHSWSQANLQQIGFYPAGEGSES